MIRPKRLSCQKGVVLPAVVLLLIIVVPLSLVFVSWLRSHAKQVVQGKIDLQSYYQSKVAIEDTRRRILSNQGTVGSNVGPGNWVSGTRYPTAGDVQVEFDPALNPGETVHVVVTHEGFNPQP